MIQIYAMFFLLFMCVFVFFITDRPRFIAFFRTMRLSRHVYYTAMTGAGFFLAARKAYLPENIFWLYFAAGVVLINILFACSLILNNIYDKKIDLANKKDNALNLAGFTRSEYLVIYFALFALSIGLSLSISVYALAAAAAIHLASYIYSCPPLRIKNIFLLNTFLIALATLMAFFLGFVIPAGAPVLSVFPWKFGAIIVAALTLSFNTKDVNDYRGDKKYGVSTLMTALGPKKGKLAIAALALAGYLLVPLLLGSAYLLVASIILGSLTFTVIYLPQKKINEPLIFLIFFIYAGIFIVINPLGF